MARIDELHNYAYPDSYLDELHTYDKSLGKNNDEIHFYGNRGVTYGLDEMHLYGSYQTEETVEDEINKPKERELIDIDEYFDEIEAIDEEQKEERKELAVEFRDILKLIFMLILADLRVGNEINEGFYLSLAKSRFMDAIDSKMPYLTIDIQTKIENYIHQNLTYVIESTMRHTDDAYYFSEVRATAIAVDDSMATYNLDELDEAIKAGYKYKIWKAMDDNRVRLDHQKVDGKKVEIDKPFEVGRCLMQAPMIFDENSHFQDAKQIINCRCTLIYSNKGDDGEKEEKETASIKLSKKVSIQQESAILSTNSDLDQPLGTKETGGHKYPIEPTDTKYDIQAKKAYETFSRVDDSAKIAKNTGFSKDDIEKVRSHVFFKKHHLEKGYMRFDPDYDMAVAWKRLQNNSFLPRDLVLLNHELLESKLEKEYNLTASEAHDRTQLTYDWDALLMTETDGQGEKYGLL